MDNQTLIKVARDCYPHNIWTTEVENGTVWHGVGTFLLMEMQRKFPQVQYQFIHQFPPSNVTNINAIALGKIIKVQII